MLAASGVLLCVPSCSEQRETKPAERASEPEARKSEPDLDAHVSELEAAVSEFHDARVEDAADDGGWVADARAEMDAAEDAAVEAEVADAEADAVVDASDAAADAGPPAQYGPPHWVTTWATAIVSDELFALFKSFSRVTLRQIVHLSIGGERVRVRISNTFGPEPLRIGAAHVAEQREGSSILPQTDRTLTFKGARSVVVPKGQMVTSDPVPLPLAAMTNLAISLYLGHHTAPQNIHRESAQTNYVSAPGNFVGNVDLPAGSAFTSWFYVDGVEVETRSVHGTVVAFGDSITDGFGSTPDLNQRWPDELARHLQFSGRDWGVANEGYAGNRVLVSGAGQAALERFDRDVLSNAGVTHVIVAEGINDIGLSNASSEQIIAGLTQLIEKAHRAGLVILGGTLCPYDGAFFYTHEGEQTRLAVNDWIRTSGRYDGIVDFDFALRDPVFPARLDPAYDCGDHLHPSNLGYEVMGQAVDLALLERAPPPRAQLHDVDAGSDAGASVRRKRHRARAAEADVTTTLQ